MKRRQYLATAAAACFPVLAGCADPEAVLEMDAVGSEDIATRASVRVTHNDDRDILAAAVENGSASASGRSPPLDPDRPVAFSGAYYDLTVQETGQRTAREFEIRIDYAPTSEPADGTVIEYGDLPEADRRALDPLFPRPGSAPDEPGYKFAVGGTYTDAETEESVLVPEQAYDAVAYEGEAYPILVGDSRDVTVYEYRYEATEVAASADAFAERIRDRHEFTLSGLSEAERDIVETAIDGEYYQGDTTDAFESLVDRFRAHTAVRADEWGGEWVTRYEGTVYWADLKHSPDLLEE